MAELKQTKGYASLKGIIGGIQSVRDGNSKYGFVDNEKVKKLQFSIKTSDDNMHYVQIMQFKMGKSMDKVYISKKDEETGKFETLAVDWSERNKPLNDGWRIIGVSLKSHNDEHAVNKVAYDAIDYVLQNFNDGDSVFINAEILHSEGRDKNYINYEIKRMYVTGDEVELEAEDFEEQSDFTEKFVFTEFQDVGDFAMVKGQAIKYNGDAVEVQYTIDKNEDAEVADYIKDEVQFGSILDVDGIINNRVVYKYREADDSEKSEGTVVGRKTKSSQQSGKIREIESENRSIQIIGINEVVPSVYTESDLGLGANESEDSIPF